MRKFTRTGSRCGREEGLVGVALAGTSALRDKGHPCPSVLSFLNALPPTLSPAPLPLTHSL